MEREGYDGDDNNNNNYYNWLRVGIKLPPSLFIVGSYSLLVLVAFIPEEDVFLFKFYNGAREEIRRCYLRFG